jgi:hypothetical protein
LDQVCWERGAGSAIFKKKWERERYSNFKLHSLVQLPDERDIFKEKLHQFLEA